MNPESLSPFWMGLILVLAFYCAVVLSTQLLRFLGRSRQKIGSAGHSASLEQWSKSVKFSDGQLTAMRSIWHAFKAGAIPEGADPFRHLSPLEMADLLKKCSFEYAPPSIRQSGEQAKRQKFMRELEEQGLDHIQAEVITGMKFGRLGPAHDV